MDARQKLNIALKNVQKINTIFTILHCFGKMHICDKLFGVSTACVVFNGSDNVKPIHIYFYEEFVNTQPIRMLEFTLCHEALHILRCHGSRFLCKGLDKQIVNIATDVSINESLIRDFGFKKEELLTDICFIENVFGKNSKYTGRESAERYYNDLYRSVKNNFGGLKYSDLNDYYKCIDQKIESIIGRSFGSMSDIEISDYFSKRLKSIKSWDSVIKRKTLEKLRQQRDVGFKLDDRKYSLLSDDWLLPGQGEEIKKCKNKTRLFFFMDISGSCSDYSETFFDAARSIPTDKFQIEAYVFDTRLKKVDITQNSKYNGGGTDFSPMLQCVESQAKYPDEVFVFTDGYAPPIYPSKPERWHIFMPEKINKYNSPRGLAGFNPKNIFCINDFVL